MVGGVCGGVGEPGEWRSCGPTSSGPLLQRTQQLSRIDSLGTQGDEQVVQKVGAFLNRSFGILRRQGGHEFRTLLAKLLQAKISVIEEFDGVASFRSLCGAAGESCVESPERSGRHIGPLSEAAGLQCVAGWP